MKSVGYRFIIFVYSISLLLLAFFTLSIFADDINQEVRLHLITSSFAILGSTFIIYAHLLHLQSRLDRNLTLTYISYPLLAVAIANIGYFVLRSMLILGGPRNVNELGVAVMGFVVGLFITILMRIVRKILDSLSYGLIDKEEGPSEQKKIAQQVINKTESNRYLSNITFVMFLFFLFLLLLFLAHQEGLVAKEFRSFFDELISGPCPNRSIICYPIESTFYPYPMLALSLSCILLCAIVIILSTIIILFSGKMIFAKAESHLTVAVRAHQLTESSLLRTLVQKY